MKAVSGNATAAPVLFATFSWNTLLLSSNVPFNETDSGVSPVCVMSSQPSNFKVLRQYVLQLGQYVL